MAMQTPAAQLLPLLLMTRGQATRAPRGISIQDGMLEDLAPFMPESAQSGMLKTASLMQAARRMQQASIQTPSVRPRNSDPVELLTTLSHYVGSQSTALVQLTQNLQRVRQLRGMLTTMPGMLQALTSAKPAAASVPARTAAPEVQHSPDLVSEFQSALSHVSPDAIRRVQEMAQTLRGRDG